MISNRIHKLRKDLAQRVYRRPLPIPDLMIEVTDKCNLACPFCAHSDLQRKTMDISRELFYEAVDQYAQMGGQVIRPYSTGEPLMCKGFLDYLRYARSKGLEIRFTTNGQLLTEKTNRQLLEIGVQNINVSVEGLNAAEYESIRIRGSFDRLKKNLTSLLELRNGQGLKQPSIRIQTVLLDDQQNSNYLKDFRTAWEPFCDSILLELCGSQGGNIDHELGVISKDDRTVCDFFYKLLCVNNDGTVSCCCVDYQRNLVVGDLKNHTLSQIWNNQRMRHFRNLARKKKYEEISSQCPKCTSISRSFSEKSRNINQTGKFPLKLKVSDLQ
jgi:radical SAM protein with 4Fe4S-binding SPASM domain